jgi:hypothetical protein
MPDRGGRAGPPYIPNGGKDAAVEAIPMYGAMPFASNADDDSVGGAIAASEVVTFVVKVDDSRFPLSWFSSFNIFLRRPETREDEVGTK